MDAGIQSSDPRSDEMVEAGLEPAAPALPSKDEPALVVEGQSVPQTSSQAVRQLCCACSCTADGCRSAWQGKGAWKLWAGTCICAVISIAIIVAGCIFGPLVFYYDDSAFVCPPPQDIGLDPAASAGYKLVQEHSGASFFDGWDFFDGDDPTEGFVNYLSREDAMQRGLAYYNETNELIYLRPDSSSVVDGAARGRDSVRLHGRRNYTYGLFTMDASHLPHGCGTWAAWWMYNDPWPEFGEIDIIEYINKDGRNSLVGHTRGGCDVPAAGASFQGTWKPNPYNPFQASTECDINIGPQGCAAWWPPGTAGRPVNESGGGTWAMEWEPDGVRVFFWSDGCGGPPQDVLAGDPQPSTWGTPMARFDFAPDKCPPERYREMFMVINLTFCGTWAGGINWGQCWVPHGFSCDNYVRDNPGAFEDAYFAIRNVRVYQKSQQE